MTTYSKLVQLVNGINTVIDLSGVGTVLLVNGLAVGVSGTSTTLTKAILDTLTSSGDASSLHNHSSLYWTIAQEASHASAITSGAYYTGVFLTPVNYTAAGPTAEQHLAGIDTKLGTLAAATTYLDGTFAILNTADNTKKIAFSAASITTGNTRTITMADAAVNLAQVNLAILGDNSGASRITTAISFNSQQIINVADPSTAQMAATKNYVDSKISGLSWKQPVNATTTVALPANAYSANVLTASANGALTVDGVAMVAGYRLLVKNEATQANNGVYDVTVAGSAGSVYVLTRDSDSITGAGVLDEAVFTIAGTVNANSGFVNTNASAPTIGTTAITYAQFTGLGQVTSGNGLQQTGNVISAKLADSSLSATGSGLAVVNDPTSAITTGASGLKLVLESSNPTLKINGSTQLAVNFSGTVSGLQALSSGLAVYTDGQTTYIDGSNHTAVKRDPTSSLTQSASGLAVFANAAGALTSASTGIAANVDGATIQISANALAAKFDTYGGLSSTASGIKASSLTMSTNLTATAAAISANDVVAQTSSGIKSAKADASANFTSVVGVAPAAISSSGTGYVTQVGDISANVEGALTINQGDMCYLSSATAGCITNVAPSSSGNAVYFIGVALAGSSGGKVRLAILPRLVATYQ